MSANKRARIWADTVDKKIDIGYHETPQLKFKNISRAEFLKYKRSYRPKLQINKSRIISTDSTFVIQTSKSRLKYKKEVNKNYGARDGYWWQEYIGFNPDLKLYVLTDNGEEEGLGFGQLFLIDSISNVRYNITSYQDGANSIPFTSPGNKYFVTYSNCEVCPDESSFIGVVKINLKNKVFTYIDFASFESKEWLVGDVAWINDRSLVLKVIFPVNHDQRLVKSIGYLKATLPN